MREGWTYKKFEEVFDLQMGKTPSRDNATYWGGDNLWVSIADLKGKYINSTKEHITNIAVSESGIKVVPKGTVIMSFKLSVGRSAITEVDLYTNEAIMAFHPKGGYKLIPDYIYYYLTIHNWSGANKAVMGLTLNKKSISSNVFAFPSLSEQERIVAELDLLSGIIEKKKAQLNEYDKLAQSIFYDMFGDPIENPKGWEIVPLNSVGTIARGVSKHRPRNAPELLGNYMPLIQTGDVANSGMYIERCQYGYSKLGVNQSKIWSSGTLCITIAANIGKCSIMTFDACFPDSIVGFTPKPNSIFVEFVYYFFNAIQKRLEDNAMGVAQKNINLKILNEMSIPLPPLSLQQSFAKKIEAIERQKALVQQSISDTQTLFDCRMDYYFN